MVYRLPSTFYTKEEGNTICKEIMIVLLNNKTKSSLFLCKLYYPEALFDNNNLSER
jgi:hypothetical protein